MYRGKLDERGEKFLEKETRNVCSFVTRCHANGGFQRLQGLIDRGNEISSGCCQQGNCTGRKEIEKVDGFQEIFSTAIFRCAG